MIKIKEIKKLMKRHAKNPVVLKQLQSDLTCWLAIKDLLDREFD